MHYVYELINLYGTVEYVGETKNTEQRFKQHTRKSKAKFYKRQDLIMNIVACFIDRKEALKFEGDLKLSYGMKWDEYERNSNAGKKGGSAIIKNGKIKLMQSKAAEGRKRKILVETLDGLYSKKFNSVIEAATELKLNKSNLASVARGYGNTISKYKAKYIYEFWTNGTG
jgi:predicted GIY-YIG superfamily endonuclease